MIQNSFDATIPLRTFITRIVIDNSFRGSVTEHSLRERPCRVASNLGGGSSQAITAWCGSQGHKGAGNPVISIFLQHKIEVKTLYLGHAMHNYEFCAIWFAAHLAVFVLDTPLNQDSLHLSSIEAHIVLRCCGANESSQPWASRRRLSLFAPWKRFWPRFPGAVRNMANCYG